MKHLKNRHSGEKKNSRLWLAAAAAFCIAVLSAGTLTLSRYVLRQREQQLATPQNFYFESDYLKESAEKAFYFIDPKTDSFQITLYNAADLHRWAASDISYTVTATGADVEDSGHGLLKGAQPSTGLLTITPTLTEGEFTVTAQASAPYEKLLTATFRLARGNQYHVEDTQGNTAAVLTITCIDNGGPISLLLPAGVVPDTTDDRVAPAENSYVFAAPGPGVYSLVLLKADHMADLSCGSTAFAGSIDLSN